MYSYWQQKKGFCDLRVKHTGFRLVCHALVHGQQTIVGKRTFFKSLVAVLVNLFCQQREICLIWLSSFDCIVLPFFHELKLYSLFKPYSYSSKFPLFPSCLLAFLPSCTLAFLHFRFPTFLHSCILAFLLSCLLVFLHSCLLFCLHFCLLALLHCCLLAFWPIRLLSSLPTLTLNRGNPLRALFHVTSICAGSVTSLI